MKYQANNIVSTKLCPFCAEQIPVQAVKCRYCGELFTPERLKLAERALAANIGDTNLGEQNLLTQTPSLWALTSKFRTGIIAFCIAFFALIIPLEKPFKPAANPAPAVSQPGSPAANQNPSLQPATPSSFYSALRKFRIIGGLLIILITALIITEKAYQLKMIRYQITPARIEYSRGLLDRKIDNLDMFRIIDMKMRQTPFDRITGVGTVIIYTTDKTDPEFRFEKIRNPGQLYDIIKKYSLDADRGGSVVHLE